MDKVVMQINKHTLVTIEEVDGKVFVGGFGWVDKSE